MLLFVYLFMGVKHISLSKLKLDIQTTKKKNNFIFLSTLKIWESNLIRKGGNTNFVNKIIETFQFNFHTTHAVLEEVLIVNKKLTEIIYWNYNLHHINRQIIKCFNL